MRIAYFVCSKTFGGMEQVVVKSTNGLCEEHFVAVIVPSGCSYVQKFAPKVFIYEYESKNSRYNIFLYYELFCFLKKHQFSLLHAHGAKATSIGFVLEKYLHVKFVATKHNIRKGKIFNKIKHVISVSKEVAKTINHQSSVIYFGMEPSKINPCLSDTFVITALGRLDRIKGFDTLIEEVSALEFDFRLNIVGEGSQRAELEKLIQKLYMEKKVFLLGYQENISEILSHSHMQVISSISEGFPLALIEGLFYSPIVLSTPVGGIVEVLDKEFLVKQKSLGQKIKQIYEEYEKFVGCFQDFHGKLKDKFTFTTYKNNLQEYYAKVLNE